MDRLIRKPIPQARDLFKIGTKLYINGPNTKINDTRVRIKHLTKRLREILFNKMTTTTLKLTIYKGKMRIRKTLKYLRIKVKLKKEDLKTMSKESSMFISWGFMQSKANCRTSQNLTSSFFIFFRSVNTMR